MKDLRKFTIKGLLLVAILVVVDLVIGVLFRSMRSFAYEQNRYSDCMVPMLATNDLDAQIVIIGASDAKHSYIPSMITDSTGLTCYNLGRDGSFTVYQSCLINLLLEEHAPQIIIWELMEDCLASDIPSSREYQSLKNLYPFYTKNSFVRNVINDMDFFQVVKMTSNMLVNNSVLMDYVNSMRSGGNGNNGYSPLPNEGYSFPNKEHDKGYPFNAPRKEKLIQETIQLCKTKGVKIIFTSAPSYSDNNIKDSECYIRLKQIAEINNIPFVDCSRMSDFFEDSTLFKDVAHLNDKGAQAYMDLFIPSLLRVISE